MAGKTVNLPKETDLGQHYNMDMGEVRHSYLDGLENPTDEFRNPLGRRTVCGFVIPKFQRGLVWTPAQNVALIESVWKGIPIGTYAINRKIGNVPDHLQNIVIDGQQRLHAIELYLSGQLEVFGGTYDDLDKVQKRFFDCKHFARYETKTSDEAYLRDYYNLMNFGGTVHTEGDRA